jgi:hypothetical protein
MSDRVLISAGGNHTLFGGAVPPNGFMVQTDVDIPAAGGDSNFFTFCLVNDDGPVDANGKGFEVVAGSRGSPAPVGVSSMFVTPPGYRPMGPVTIACDITQGGVAVFIEARGW